MCSIVAHYLCVLVRLGFLSYRIFCVSRNFVSFKWAVGFGVGILQCSWISVRAACWFQNVCRRFREVFSLYSNRFLRNIRFTYHEIELVYKTCGLLRKCFVKHVNSAPVWASYSGEDVVFWWSRGSTLGKHRCGVGQTKSGKFGVYTSAWTLQGTLKGFRNNEIPRSSVLIKCVIFKSAQCIKFDPLSFRHFLPSMALFRSRTSSMFSSQQVSRLLSDYLIFALHK